MYRIIQSKNFRPGACIPLSIIVRQYLSVNPNGQLVLLKSTCSRTCVSEMDVFHTPIETELGFEWKCWVLYSRILQKKQLLTTANGPLTNYKSKLKQHLDVSIRKTSQRCQNSCAYNYVLWLAFCLGSYNSVWYLWMSAELHCISKLHPSIMPGTFQWTGNGAIDNQYSMMTPSGFLGVMCFGFFQPHGWRLATTNMLTFKENSTSATTKK